MKTKSILINLCVLAFLFTTSCFNKSAKQGAAGEEEVNANDSTEILLGAFKNDKKKIEYEVSVRKGTKIKHGIQTRYYPHGSVYSKINYKDGKKSGMAYTYYQAYSGEEPKVWKAQPYTESKLDGICKRYYKSGKIQAEYEYYQGLKAVGLKEWKKSGDPVNLPTLKISKKVVNHQTYLTVKMSNGAKKVKYYETQLLKGKYVTKNVVPLSTANGVGEITIPHTSSRNSITIIAELSTRNRNKYYVAKTLALK